jgi:hypothetical protein
MRGFLHVGKVNDDYASIACTRIFFFIQSVWLTHVMLSLCQFIVVYHIIYGTYRPRTSPVVYSSQYRTRCQGSHAPSIDQVRQNSAHQSTCARLSKCLQSCFRFLPM